MAVKFKQIAAAFEQTPDGRGNVHLYALDENGQLWEKLRDVCGKVEHPDDGAQQTVV